MFLRRPDEQLSCFALGLKRKATRILVGLLARHTALNRHLTVMKIRTDPLCCMSHDVEVQCSFLVILKCC